MKKAYKSMLLFSIVLLLLFAKKDYAQDQVRPELRNFGITPYINDWTKFDEEKQVLFESPFVKNIMLMFKWKELEPAPGDFRFDELIGKALKESREAGKGLGIMIWVGPSAPDWIYQNGVPIVKLPGTGRKQETVNPYYFSEAYKTFFYRLIDEFSKYIVELNDIDLKNIIYFQVAEGSTGDTRPYTGAGDPINKEYTISPQSWMDFRMEVWKRYKTGLWKNGRTAIPLLFTDDANTDRERNWQLANFPEFGVKKGHLAHGYNNNFSLRLIGPWLKLQKEAENKGVFVFARGEYDNILLNNGWVRKRPELVFYWSALAAVHNDIHFWNPSTKIIRDADKYEEGLVFYNSHIKNLGAPSQADYAFCAMRRMLDAEDIETFPEKIYGKATRNNLTRYQNIIAGYLERGAKINDETKLSSGPMESRRRDDDNDIGWNVYRGNFYKYLKQIAPEQTSEAHWNFDSLPYGRFVRGFKGSKSKMYFSLDKKFFGDDLPHHVQISIVYKDMGTGTWDLLFYDGSNTMSAGKVKNTDSGKWITQTFTLSSAVFTGKLENNADIVLRHLNGDNTFFHLIDLKRERLNNE